MSNLDEAFREPAVESLASLSMLLESDPEAIGAMSPREVDEGLRVMNLCNKATLPETLAALLSPAPSRGKRWFGRRNPVRARVPGFLSAFVLFLILGLFRVFRSKNSWAAACIAFLIGFAIAVLILLGIENSKAASRGETSHYSTSALQLKLSAVNLEKQTIAERNKKLADRARYLACVNDALRRTVQVRIARNRLVMHRLDQALAVFEGTLKAEGSEASPPNGAPVDGTAVPISTTSVVSGLKYSVTPGTQVRATGSGIVIENEPEKDGRRVRIAHEDGLVTIYGPLAETVVSPGQPIQAGKTLGYAVASRAHNLVNVNYQISKNGQPERIVGYIKPKD